MTKRKSYTDELKTKVILEVLKEENTIAEIASKHEIHATTIREWKKQFLVNINLAINPEKGIDKYKEKIKESEKEKDELYKEIGKLSAELSWAKKKSKEFGIEY